MHLHLKSGHERRARRCRQSLGKEQRGLLGQEDASQAGFGGCQHCLRYRGTARQLIYDAGRQTELELADAATVQIDVQRRVRRQEQESITKTESKLVGLAAGRLPAQGATLLVGPAQRQPVYVLPEESPGAGQLCKERRVDPIEPDGCVRDSGLGNSTHHTDEAKVLL